MTLRKQRDALAAGMNPFARHQALWKVRAPTRCELEWLTNSAKSRRLCLRTPAVRQLSREGTLRRFGLGDDAVLQCWALRAAASRAPPDAESVQSDDTFSD